MNFKIGDLVRLPARYNVPPRRINLISTTSEGRVYSVDRFFFNVPEADLIEANTPVVGDQVRYITHIGKIYRIVEIAASPFLTQYWVRFSAMPRICQDKVLLIGEFTLILVKQKTVNLKQTIERKEHVRDKFTAAAKRLAAGFHGQSADTSGRVESPELDW